EQERCGIIFDGLNDAGKNHRKLHLQWSRHKVLSAGNFLRLRGHVKNTLFRSLTSVNQSPTSSPAPATGGFLLGRLSQDLILMGLFIASPPIERRHTRQRIAEKPSRQVARLELGSAITIRQRQGTGPNARREHEVSGLTAASSFIQDFGHCSFPPYGLPKPQP